MTQDIPTELSCLWQGQLNDYVTAVVANPHGQSWAASSAAGEIVYRDRVGALQWLQTADGRSISALAWSSDGQWLAAGGESGVLKLWRWSISLESEPQPQAQLQGITSGWIEGIVWHPTQPYLAVARVAEIEIWDVSLGQQIAHLHFDRSSVFDLAWHPHGEHLAVAGYKGVQIWQMADWTAPPLILPVETASIKIAWSATGDYLAAGNLDRTISIWESEHLADPWILQGCPGKIRQLQWATDRPLLAVATGTDIVIWQLDATNPQEQNWVGELGSGHEAPVLDLALHPDFGIASAGADGYVCLWTETGTIAQILENPHTFSRFTNLSWNLNYLFLATGDENGGLAVFSVSK